MIMCFFLKGILDGFVVYDFIYDCVKDILMMKYVLWYVMGFEDVLLEEECDFLFFLIKW